MRSALLVVAGLALALTTACGADDAKSGAPAPPSGTSSPSDPSTPASPTGSDRTFAPEDYSYVLVRSCRCPFTVPVAVTVRDGEVTSAVARGSARTVREGDPAPDSHRLTINDIIDLAADPDMHARVDWPDGQAWPDRVRTDPIERAIDDEVTYVIKRVEVR